MTSGELDGGDREDLLRSIGLAVAALGPLVVAGLLVPARGQVSGENIALVFVVVVVLAAAYGGRGAGALAAVVSAMSYDFFFTRPYQSLKIDRADDLGTVILLLAISVLIAELMALGQRRRQASMRAREDLTRLSRVAAAAAEGVDPNVVVRAVEAELTGLLGLQDCRFERPPFGASLPRLERSGAIDGGRRRYVSGQLTLPGEGLELPVVGRGRVYGRFVLMPDWHVGVSLEERVVAIALADLASAAFAAEPTRTRRSIR